VRRIGTIVAQSLAAVLGVGLVFVSLLDEIMGPSFAAADRARIFALIAIALLTAAVVVAELKRRAVPAIAVVAAMVLTLAAGAWPIYVYDKEKHEAKARSEVQRLADAAAADAKALARIEARRRDVESRLAERRPYAGQDALQFVVEVSYADLRYLGLSDRSETVRALLKRALDEKLIDPNVPVKGSRPVDTKPEPLFLQYYRADVRPYPTAQISMRNWETLKLLVANGADLTLEGAALGGGLEEIRRRGIIGPIHRTAVAQARAFHRELFRCAMKSVPFYTDGGWLFGHYVRCRT